MSRTGLGFRSPVRSLQKLCLTQAQEFVLGVFVFGTHGVEALLTGVYKGSLASARVFAPALFPLPAVLYMRGSNRSRQLVRRSSLCPSLSRAMGTSLDGRKDEKLRVGTPEAGCSVRISGVGVADHLRRVSYLRVQEDEEAPDLRTVMAGLRKRSNKNNKCTGDERRESSVPRLVLHHSQREVNE